MYHQYKEKTRELQEKRGSYFEKKSLAISRRVIYIIHAKLINI